MDTNRPNHTWKITVVKPCNCSSCANGGRWFQCMSDEPIVAEYGVIQPGVLQPEQIKFVQDEHPGMDLIY